MTKPKKVFKILIIDDEPDILELLAEEFKLNGHYVSTAMSGNEAIQILQDKHFDIILSDYRMPNGNGMDILKFVTTLIKQPQFFFLSVHSDESVYECLKAGA